MKNTLWKKLTWFFHMELWCVITAIFCILGELLRQGWNLRLSFLESHMICQHIKMVKLFGARMCNNNKPSRVPRLVSWMQYSIHFSLPIVHKFLSQIFDNVNFRIYSKKIHVRWCLSVTLKTSSIVRTSWIFRTISWKISISNGYGSADVQIEIFDQWKEKFNYTSDRSNSQSLISVDSSETW